MIKLRENLQNSGVTVNSLSISATTLGPQERTQSKFFQLFLRLDYLIPPPHDVIQMCFLSFWVHLSRKSIRNT